MRKWLFLFVWVAVVIWLMWYLRILQAVGGAFDVWLRWIGSK
jgi:hypothetical protein